MNSEINSTSKYVLSQRNMNEGNYIYKNNLTSNHKIANLLNENKMLRQTIESLMSQRNFTKINEQNQQLESHLKKRNTIMGYCNKQKKINDSIEQKYQQRINRIRKFSKNSRNSHNLQTNRQTNSQSKNLTNTQFSTNPSKIVPKNLNHQQSSLKINQRDLCLSRQKNQNMPKNNAYTRLNFEGRLLEEQNKLQTQRINQTKTNQNQIQKRKEKNEQIKNENMIFFDNCLNEAKQVYSTSNIESICTDRGINSNSKNQFMGKHIHNYIIKQECNEKSFRKNQQKYCINTEKLKNSTVNKTQDQSTLKDSSITLEEELKKIQKNKQKILNNQIYMIE